MCISSSWLLPKWRFLAKDLHLQCVLGNPRTGGVRSCSWYCRKELVLGVGRVNVPGNLFWLKNLGNAPYRKGVFGCALAFVFGWSRGSRASVGVDCFVPCPPSVAPRIGFTV